MNTNWDKTDNFSVSSVSDNNSHNPEIPPYVAKFLALNKESRDLRMNLKKCRSEISSMESSVGEWLSMVPGRELLLDFNNDSDISQYGPSGKIRFVLQHRRESLNENTLQRHLANFFDSLGDTMPSVEIPSESVHRLAAAAAEHVWASRESLQNRLVAMRTYGSKKRKMDPDTS